MTDLAAHAADNLKRLARNPYPGRGIVLGRSADGHRMLQVYWIMGRSPNSRNRVFVAEEGRLRTQPLDPSRMAHPELVIYTAMDAHGHQHVVTNGDHTDTVIEALRQGADYRQALRGRAHEPDAPHYTPRIAGGIHADSGKAWLALLKADPHDPSHSVRAFYEFEALPAGYGWCIHTYQGDGDPLPPFGGEPYPVSLEGEGETLLSGLWSHLNEENRISMALKTLEPDGRAKLHLINKYATS